MEDADVAALDSLSKAGTLTALHWSEWIVLLFGVVLVMGLIGEIVKSPIHRWYKRFELMVVIGVAGELLGDGGIFVFTERLEAINETEVAQLDNTVFKLGRLALQTYDAVDARHRVLRPEEGQRIKERLLPFAGTQYDFGVDVTPEAINLMLIIDRVLKSAGWKWLPSNAAFSLSPLGARMVIVTGIQVWISKRQEAAGAALCDGLTVEGKLVPSVYSDREKYPVNFPK
jgi:hypothetical protein